MAYKTVKECIEAGHTWDQCMGFTVKGDDMKVVIKKSCPEPMVEFVRDIVFKGKPVTFTREEDDK